MNAHIVCLLAVLSAESTLQEWQPVSTPLPEFAVAQASQNPPYEELPSPEVQYGETPPTYSFPGGGVFSPFHPAPVGQDPFLQPGAIPPYRAPGIYAGPHGPQPYRLGGWRFRGDVGFLPKEGIAGPGTNGQFEVFETNVELENVMPFYGGWIFSVTPQFNFRTWDGPNVPGLPGQVFRFGGDFELATPGNSPWSVQLGFNPSLNSDLEQEITADAWNWDGRGILFFRYSPSWLLVGGAGYWDRVNDRVIPYAGVVWTPDDRWEWRILFPEWRISYFLGNCGGVASWIYYTGEYHVEAYQIRVQNPGVPAVREKIEVEDLRMLLGIRTESWGFSGFIEAGFVFARQASFLNGTAGFDVSSGFIGRLGLRF